MGHVVSDDHLAQALQYLRAKTRGDSSEIAVAGSEPKSKANAPKGKPSGAKSKPKKPKASAARKAH